MKLPRRPLRTVAALSLVAVLAACGGSDDGAAPLDPTAASNTATRDTGESTPETGSASPAPTGDAGATAAEVLAANEQPHQPAAVPKNEKAIDLSTQNGTVTLTEPGTYRLAGTLNDGQVVVNSRGAVRLLLAGATITSATSAAIAVVAATDAVVELAEGTTNSLTDAATYADTNDDAPSGALFSRADLTITGGGRLTVKGNSNDGINSRDGLVISGGTIVVDAVDDAVRGKDYVDITGGTLTAKAGGDGIKSDHDTDAKRGYIRLRAGTVTVTSVKDGLQATTDLVVEGGKLAVTSGGGSSDTVAADGSAKALKGGVNVVIAGGAVVADAADDAVHSNGSVSIQDGTLTLSSADDGIHTDSDLTIAGGTTTVKRSYEGLEGGAVTIAGGTIDVTASDDGVNVAGGNDSSGTQAGPGGRRDAFAVNPKNKLTITGGTLTVNADGDGLDSNGTVTMSGGTVVVHGPTMNGNGALDSNGAFTVSGGTLLAVGSSGMAEAPETSSPQNWVSATLATTQPAGTKLQIVDSAGQELVSFTALKPFGSVVYSAPALKKNAQYTVKSGSIPLATVTAGQHTGGMRGGPGMGGLRDLPGGEPPR